MEDELLRAIFDHPDDDAPREAYAAYLTAKDDPRGAFIAADVAWARGDEQAGKRSNELARKHPGMSDPHVPGFSVWLVQRGFASQLRCSAEAFIAGADGLFERVPPCGISITGEVSADALERISKTPALRRVRGLWFENGMGDDALRILATSEYLDGIHWLVAQPTNEIGVDALLAPSWTSLRKLTLMKSPLDDALLGRLLGATGMPALTELVLEETITPTFFRSLWNAPKVRRLKRLSLARTKLTGLFEPLGAWFSPFELEVLALEKCELTDKDAQQLVAAWTKVPKLRELDLRDNHVQFDGMTHLASMPSLKRLLLSGNGIASPCEREDWDPGCGDGPKVFSTSDLSAYFGGRIAFT